MYDFNNKILTIIVPQYSEDESTIKSLLMSINIQIGIDLSSIDIKIIGDGGYKLSSSLFSKFPNLNIKYIYNNNSNGPGISRQIGTDLAKSTYIAYMDADDQLNTVNSLWKYIDVINKTGNHKVIFSRYVEEFPPDESNRNSFKVREFNPSAAYGKWIKLSYIRENNFQWHPLLNHAYEDTFFLDLVMVFSDDTYFMDSPTYSWLYHENSIVREGNDYNSIHLNEYILENRLWAIEIKKRSPNRLNFDVNNGIVNMYYFMVKHPPIKKIKELVDNEIKKYLIENKENVNLQYSANIFHDRYPNMSIKAYTIYWKNYLDKLDINYDLSYFKRNVTLSIIIPFHGENISTIYPLLCSIEYQIGIDKENVEILIIKDGGKKISNKLTRMFKLLNIKLFHSLNSIGPGPARNIGIRNAENDYLMFCDADDQLSKVNSLYLLCQNIIYNPDAQIVMSKYNNEIMNLNGTSHLEKYNFNYGAVYPNLYNACFLKENNIKFHPSLHSYYEDTYFVGLSINIANNVEYDSNYVYTHKYNNSSLIHLSDKNYLHRKFLVEFCKENYYWFKSANIYFPQNVYEDLKNFIINLYYMYEDYGIKSTNLDSNINYYTKKIIKENITKWDGWNDELQSKADNYNYQYNSNIKTDNLKNFIHKFM